MTIKENYNMTLTNGFRQLLYPGLRSGAIIYHSDSGLEIFNDSDSRLLNLARMFILTWLKTFIFELFKINNNMMG